MENAGKPSREDFYQLIDEMAKDPSGSMGATSAGVAVLGDIPEAAVFPDLQSAEGGPSVTTTADTFRDMERKEGRKDVDTLDVIAAELKTSPLGTAARALTFGDGYENKLMQMAEVFASSRMNDVDWEPADFERLEASGLSPQFWHMVTRGSRDRFDANLELALANQAENDTARRGSVGQRIVGGIVAAPADPLSYVPVAGAYLKGGNTLTKLAAGAITGAPAGAASEALRGQVSGVDHDILMGAVGGAAGGALVVGGVLWVRAAFTKGPASSEASEVATQLRLESRLEAQAQGKPDPANKPLTEADEVVDINGAPYAVNPDGSVRTADGSVISAGNPLNPNTVKKFADMGDDPVRANMGLKAGDYTELGLHLGRSEDPTIRAIASNLVRSPTGYKDGSSGKFGATVDDIVGRIGGLDRQDYAELDQLIEKAAGNRWYSLKPTLNSARYDRLGRRVVEALERGDKSGLSKAEAALVDKLKSHMERYEGYITNPAQFGNLSAPKLLTGSHWSGNYFPVVYMREARQAWIRELGGAEELQEAIMRGFLQSYATRPAVKKRVDDFLIEEYQLANKDKPGIQPDENWLRARVQEYANAKAYGIAQTDEFVPSTKIDDQLDGLVGFENNGFLEARQLFDMDIPVDVGNGRVFAVNDLRDMNIGRIVPSYDRRVRGDVAIAAATGKKTDELKQEILALKGKVNAKDYEALEQFVKAATGRQRRESPDDMWGFIGRSLNDLAFATKNAYMAPLNLTEAAKLVVSGHIKMATRHVPVFKDLVSGKTLDVDGVEMVHKLVFGRELENLIRPQRADLIEHLREGMGRSKAVATAVGTVRYVTQEIAARSPLTRAIPYTTNALIDMGRVGLISDLADYAITGTTKRSLLGSDMFSEGRLTSASLTKEQFDGVLALLRTHVVRDADGKYTLKDVDKLQADVRSMDLFRLVDRYADEVIIRPHKLGSQPVKQFGALGAMIMMFKNFVFRSVNARTVRGWAEATKNGQAIDQAMQVVIASAAAAAFYAAQRHMVALGMPEEKREDYLAQALSPEMLQYAAISRSSHIGGVLGVANIPLALAGWEPARMVRTSVLPHGDTRADDGGRPIVGNPLTASSTQDFMSRAAEQVPAAGLVLNAYKAAHNAMQLGTSKRPDDDLLLRTGLFQALKNFVPNDPVSQTAMLKIAEASGIDRSR